MTAKQHLIEFIKAVGEQARPGDSARAELTLGSLFGTSADGVMPSMRFGYGYHAADKVLYRPGRPEGSIPAAERVADPAEAVDLFFAAYGLK